MSDMGSEELKDTPFASDASENDRLHILTMIESGEIDVEEGLKRLQGGKPEHPKRDVLSQLEAGDIDVAEAIRLIEHGSHFENEATTAPVQAQESSIPDSTAKWRSWWLLIPALGLAITAFGGWLGGTIGGWWWVVAGPALLVGILLLIFALLTQDSPWLHVRIDTGQETWPRRIAFSFPVPIRIASWGLRRWGHYADGLDATAIDELLLSLEGNLSSENPIHIEVNEDDETGERIQVFLG